MCISRDTSECTWEGHGKASGITLDSYRSARLRAMKWHNLVGFWMNSYLLLASTQAGSRENMRCS